MEIARTDITAVEDAMLAEPEKPDIFHYYLDKLKKIVCITAQCEPYINKEKIWKKIRIQKIMSDSGVCSRRKAEEYISEGRVKVNGRPCKLGDKALAGKDIITL